MYQCLFIVCVILCRTCYAEQCVLSAIPPDPKSGCCGLANGNSLKKFTSKADIDEYPWMALVEYKKNDSIKFLCSAILISGQYALSAAHCFSKHTLAVTGTPTNVRLGEYDVNNAGKDCVEVKPGQEVCNDGAVSVPIEKITSHPDFIALKQNDIVLLRLAKIVTYTDFIRPICLPLVDITLHAPKNFYMTVAGWGAVNTNITESNVLRRVHVPFVETQICENSYKERYNFNITIANTQLCAGSKNRDACKGDSGSPLMYFNSNKTELGGIVSFGPKVCGQDNPSVYTKAFLYKDWIHSVIAEDSKTSSSTSTTTDSGLIYFRE